MNQLYRRQLFRGCLSILYLLTLFSVTPVSADSFTVSNGETVFNVPTLNEGETGIIERGSSLITQGSTQSVILQGNNATFENRGTISVSENFSQAIYISASNTKVTNDGTITTNEALSSGIAAFDQSNNTNITNTTIINNGTINTKQSTSAAIASGSFDSKITNNGTLLMEGESSWGISVGGSLANIVNNGTIKTLKRDSFGIISGTGSSNDNIVNNGVISTSGDSSLGIKTRGTLPTITNNGSLTTEGDGSNAIQLQGESEITLIDPQSGNLISISPTNNGGSVIEIVNPQTGEVSVITVPGKGGAPIKTIVGTVTNNGTITTNGDDSSGIVAGTLITNNETIQTMGDGSHAIRSTSEFATVNNNGTLSTTGTGSHGIFSTGNGTTISNTSSDSIKTSGAGSIGINVTGDNITINNSGRIAATGNSTVAIQGGGNNETLNLLAGSQIQGIIDLGGGTNTINIFGTGSDRPSSSSTLSFNGTANVNTFGENIVNSGGVIQVVDVTGLSSNASALGMTTTGIHGSLINHLTHSSPSRPVQLAASRVEPGMVPDDNNQRAWLGGFGAYRERGEDSRSLDYDQAVYGFSGGYNISFRRFKAGLMAGFSRSDLSTEIQSIDNNTDSYFLGGYGQTRFAGITFSAALLGGYQDHSNDRQVMDNLTGPEVAQSDFDGYFFSPAINLGTTFNLGQGVELRPSGSLIYSLAFQDDYTETGTTRSNISIPDRTAQALIGRLQLAAGYDLSRKGEIEFRIGGMSRYTDEDNATASFAGTPFQYSTVTDETVFGGYVGGNYRLTLSDCLHLTGDFEYGVLEGNEDYTLGQLELQFSF